MNKHALVVGSQTAGLSGPIGDAERVATMLGKEGFRVDLRTTKALASRQGIVDGYRQLVSNAAGGAAVFYYSGHGVRALPSRTPPPGSRSSYQAIVPKDFEDSTEDRFLGITDVELSTMLALLTSKTANATVILDCCHSAAMSRGDVESRPKSLPVPSYLDLQRHIARVVEEDELPVDLLESLGNLKAVRLVAAGESQSAYERFVGDQMVGTFTESLLLALAEAKGQRVTWEGIGRFVRERVLGIHASQRADVEGPLRRYLFDVDEAPPSGAVGVVSAAGGALLRAGRLHGVRVGDGTRASRPGSSRSTRPRDRDREDHAGRCDERPRDARASGDAAHRRAGDPDQVDGARASRALARDGGGARTDPDRDRGQAPVRRPRRRR
ncbi:MAG: caspase family protein [Kofleriaceae bacterium]